MTISAKDAYIAAWLKATKQAASILEWLRSTDATAMLKKSGKLPCWNKEMEKRKAYSHFLEWRNRQ